MLHRVFLPQLGQTMEEGTIEKWHKQEGDTVAKGEVLYELTTDKATLEVEAFAAGVVKKILADEGRTLPVNQLIAVIGDADDEVPEEFLQAQPAPPAAEPGAAGGASAASAPSAPAAGAPSAVGTAVAEAPPAAAPAADRLFASPRARKVAGELRVPVSALRGTGPQGRVVERDVLTYAEALEDVRHTPAAAALAYEMGVSLLEVATTAEGHRITKDDVQAAVSAGLVRPAAGVLTEERVAFTPMRKTIAQRMAAAKQSVPHFYLIGDISMGPARDLLRRMKAEGRRATVTALLIKAVGIALREHPRVNARFDGDGVILNRGRDVGVAVAVEDGLFVPVVRGADVKDLQAISRELRSLAETARDGKLIPEQYEGGSITISNLGMFGVDYFLPIINEPQSCIIGVGQITDQVVVRDGGIRVEQVMKISLSADHRVIDGALCATFFQTLREILEDPSALAD
jgi:pyruvate dehydrogenase E2 component (dihydrolipoamide acetyltransferase)